METASLMENESVMSGSDAERRFLALYEANVVALLGYAARRVDRREDAADVVADVFMTAWRRIEEVPPDNQTRPWLFGVARKALSNHRRSARRRQRLHGRIRNQVQELISTPWSGHDDVHVVRRALKQLSADDRELLLLTNWEGLSPSEIAVAMNIPPGTVRSRLHRARNRLRHELSPSDAETDGAKRFTETGKRAVANHPTPVESEEH